MEENKKSGKAPLIYAIVGVAVLIVAVAGSTFAFFTASATAETPIAGETLDIDLGISIKKISEDGAKGAGLIPIHDGTNGNFQLDQAIEFGCSDVHGYTVCQIYEITLTNGGKDTIPIEVQMEVDETTKQNYKNLKWAKMASSTDLGLDAENIAMGADSGSALETSLVHAGDVGPAGDKVYLLIYVNNTGEDQSDEDSGAFNGTLTVTSSTGAQVQAEF